MFQMLPHKVKKPPVNQPWKQKSTSHANFMKVTYSPKMVVRKELIWEVEWDAYEDVDCYEVDYDLGPMFDRITNLIYL